MARRWQSWVISWSGRPKRIREDLEEDQEEKLIDGERRVKPTWDWRWSLPFGLAVFILLIVTIVPTQLARHPSSPSTVTHNIFPSEFFDWPTVEYKEVFFTPPAWTGQDAYDEAVYDGPPTGKANLMWHELMDVGIMSLSEERARSLQIPTAKASDSDQTPLVQLDVFHQLHCLNALRKFVFAKPTREESDWSKELVHINHCIDQLRQSLMCHSDLSIIYHVPRPPKEKSPQLPTWKANFSAPHTCRNFWALHDWAKKYNTSGFEIERWNDEEFL
ncbi:hypothetical protein PVAG01_08599 [Phlyctema vagabunda]|uniref:Cyclochlorotine biosynthesis protein O n=1 Tax=Phlyctema vagabunda TaxID=108571 RepID=A0ABR4P9V4_9HELO